MGLRSDVQTDVAAAFDGDLADAVQSFTASRETVSDTFDAATGTYPTVTVTYSGRWARSEWSRQELDSQHIQSTDIKRLVLQNETEWTPAVDDTVNGYRVVDFQQDGVEALWTVQLRRT